MLQKQSKCDFKCDFKCDLNATVNATVKLNETEKSILSIIKENSKVTINEISEKLEKHRVTIARSINSLKEKGILIRNGSDKTGYWEVKD